MKVPPESAEPLAQHDIVVHRGTSMHQYSRSDRIRRILWAALSPAFRLSPRLLYGWRNMLLRVFGARIGRAVRIYPSVRVFAPWRLVIGDEVTVGWNATIYNLAPITVGSRTMISQNTHLCAGDHDYRRPELPFANRPIQVGSDCWICADAFIGPGVTIGPLAVVGARAVVVKDVPERALVAGNPARVIGQR